MRHSRVMSDDEDTDEWLAQICERNEASGSSWSARFEIPGPSMVEEAVRELALIGATLTANGPHQQYLVKFPVHQAREVVRIVAAQDGVLCRRQSTIIDEAAPSRPIRRCATPVLALAEGRLKIH
jgi:hypothetical protein